MANTLTTSTVYDNVKNLVVTVDISGDGSGEESSTQIVGASSYSAMTGKELKIVDIQANLKGFAAQLLLDSDVGPNLVEGGNFLNYKSMGGLIHTGDTGNINITTSGLGAGDFGTIVLTMKKRSA